MTDLFAPEGQCLGCELVASAPVTLHDARVVCNTCPDWRLECEARSVTKMESREARAEYLNGVDAKRGKAAGQQLRDMVRVLWEKR